MLIIVTSILIILSIVIATYIINNITKSIKFILSFINKTASLDLAFDESRLNAINRHKDEFFDMSMAVATMRKVLRELVNNIKQNSINVSSSADNLSNIIGETSESIECVAKSIDDMAKGSIDLARNVEDGAEKLQTLLRPLHHKLIYYHLTQLLKLQGQVNKEKDLLL